MRPFQAIYGALLTLIGVLVTLNTLRVPFSEAEPNAPSWPVMLCLVVIVCMMGVVLACWGSSHFLEAIGRGAPYWLVPLAGSIFLAMVALIWIVAPFAADFINNAEPSIFVLVPMGLSVAWFAQHVYRENVLRG